MATHMSGFISTWSKPFGKPQARTSSCTNFPNHLAAQWFRSRRSALRMQNDGDTEEEIEVDLSVRQLLAVSMVKDRIQLHLSRLCSELSLDLQLSQVFRIVYDGTDVEWILLQILVDQLGEMSTENDDDGKQAKGGKRGEKGKPRQKAPKLIISESNFSTLVKKMESLQDTWFSFCGGNKATIRCARQLATMTNLEYVSRVGTIAALKALNESVAKSGEMSYESGFGRRTGGSKGKFRNDRNSRNDRRDQPISVSAPVSASSSSSNMNAVSIFLDASPSDSDSFQTLLEYCRESCPHVNILGISCPPVSNSQSPDFGTKLVQSLEVYDEVLAASTTGTNTKPALIVKPVLEIPIDFEQLNQASKTDNSVISSWSMLQHSLGDVLREYCYNQSADRVYFRVPIRSILAALEEELDKSNDLDQYLVGGDDEDGDAESDEELLEMIGFKDMEEVEEVEDEVGDESEEEVSDQPKQSQPRPRP